MNSDSNNHIMAPGTQARLISDNPPLNIGDVVTIIKFDANLGYLVSSNMTREEYYISSKILSTFNRKPWSFRFKKNNTRLNRSFEIDSINESTSNKEPEFIYKLKDITISNGSKVVLKCKIKNVGTNSKISWKKLEPNLCVLRNGKFVLCENNEGIATLVIENAQNVDSGLYSFSISNEYGTNNTSCNLNVIDNFCNNIPEPKILKIRSSSVHIEFKIESNDEHTIEYCKLGSGEWILSNNNDIQKNDNNFICTIDNLTPGETYSFRVKNTKYNIHSLPSVAVTLPISDNLKWQQEQFFRRYSELKEIDRGRFSIVKLAKDKGTNVEVALKQIIRRKQPLCITQAEYTLLASMEHQNIIKSLVLFENAPMPGVDTIVLELVKGTLLFTYLSEINEYTEETVRNFSLQLMNALSYLHDKNISHLDIKPENVMVDIPSQPSKPTLKLIDFGDSVGSARSVIPPPACLEFAAPELVLGRPPGCHTDLWATGVFIYCLLSGVSPFLDESTEETTANILKCDYCFPNEYFENVSACAKEVVGALLVAQPSDRKGFDVCKKMRWMNLGEDELSKIIISSVRLKFFMARRKPSICVGTSYQGEHIF